MLDKLWYKQVETFSSTKAANDWIVKSLDANAPNMNILDIKVAWVNLVERVYVVYEVYE